MIEGKVKVEDFASFEVNETNRKQICANHSVTHLVHKALRTILGEHVTQKDRWLRRTECGLTFHTRSKSPQTN